VPNFTVIRSYLEIWDFWTKKSKIDKFSNAIAMRKSLKFSRHLAPKILAGSEKVWGAKVVGHVLSVYKVWWRSVAARRRETEKFDVFFTRSRSAGIKFA